MSSDDQVYQQIQNISSAFDTLKSNFEKKNRQIETLLRQKENLTCTCQDQALWIDKLQHQIEQLHTDRKQLEEKLEQFTNQQQQIGEIERKYSNSQTLVSNLQKQLAGTEKENTALKTELKTLADARNRYESELKASQEKDRRIESLTGQLTQINTKVNDLTEQLNHQIEPAKDDPSDDLVNKLNQKLKNCKQIFGDLHLPSNTKQVSADDSESTGRKNLHRQLSILSGS